MAKHWISKAIKRPGALRAKAGVGKGETIPLKKLDELARSSNPRTRRQASLAKTLKSMHKR